MTDFTSPQLTLGALAWLLTYLLHSTILIGGIWCVLRLRVIRSAATEDVLWKIGLVGALLTATLQTVAGIEPVSGTYALGSDAPAIDATSRPVSRPVVGADIALGLLSVDGAPDIRFAFREAPHPRSRRLELAPFLASPVSGDPAPSREARVPAVRPSSPPLLGSGSSAVLASGIERVDRLPVVLPPPAARPVEASGPSALAWIAGRWMAIAAVLWVVLAAMGLGRFLCLRRRLLRALGTRKPVTSVRMLSILGRLEHRAGISGAVQLTCSPFLSGPVALGRREICVPSRAVTSLEPQQQEALLAHELAHIRRRDPQWLNLCALLEAVFFFQPLNRLARTRLQAASEFLCDDWAVDSTGRRVTLAQCLAEVASWIEDSQDVLPVASMARPDSSLVKRIRRIADRPPKQQALRRSATALLAMTLLGAVSCSVPGISSGASGGSVIEQIEAFVQRAFRSLSSMSTEIADDETVLASSAATQDSAAPTSDACDEATDDACCQDADAPSATSSGCADHAPCPAAAPAVVEPDSGAASPFRRRLERPDAPDAPDAPRAPAVGRVPSPAPARPAPTVWRVPSTGRVPAPASVPATPGWPVRVVPRTPRVPRADLPAPLVRFQRALPAPVQPDPAAAFSPRQVYVVQDADGQADDAIVLRIVDGEAVGVDSSGRTFRIVGVDQADSSAVTRIEVVDGQLRVTDGDGETLVTLDLDEMKGGSAPRVEVRNGRGDVIRAPRIEVHDASRFLGAGDGGLDLAQLQRDLDRELRDIEREYEAQMKDLERTMSELERSLDRAQRDLSREFEETTQAGQREYDAAIQEWTREFERGSEEMARTYEQILDEFQREFDGFQDEFSGDPEVLEELIEEWEDRQSGWENGFEEEWEDWEASLEEELESLEDEYETWWEVVESDFDQAFEDVEADYESEMIDWESGFEELEEQYEDAFAEWEELFDEVAMSWDLRDCDHDCESECAMGCTHPEGESDCEDATDCEGETDCEDVPDEELLVEAGVN